MKFIKAAVLFVLGSLALVLAPGAAPVHAQSTQAAAAAAAEFKKSCSAEIATMKATLASKGENVNDAELDGFLEALPAQMREAATFAEMSADAFYRESAARTRAEAAKPDNPDKSAALMAPVYLCLVDVLLRLETEGAARPAPSVPAAPETSPAVDGCITIDWGTGKRGEPGLLRNSCGYALNVGYCVSQPTAGSTSASVSCEQARYTSYEIGSKSAALLLMTDGPNVHWRACRPPYQAFLWTDAGGKSVGECRSR